VAGCFALAVLAVVVWRAVAASLPLVDGTRPLPGLTANVTVERDAVGVPTIAGRTREDVARATGFVHAQERYFQMDLARRFAAGELSELVGEAALPVDRALRPHRFRAVAAEALHRATPVEQRLLEAYAAGVNEGRDALGAIPVEYLLLRADPAPWRAEDSFLVLAFMYVGLQRGVIGREPMLGLMRETLPAPLAAFLEPGPDEWEAPIAGTPPAPPPLPTEPQANVRTGWPDPPSPPGRALVDPRHPEAMRGSNSWAVAPAHTARGTALLANDMHLDLQVPNAWFRVLLTWPDGSTPGGQRRVVGVTLPGVPAVVVGSNGRVAWGFTNAGIDAADFVLLEPDAASPVAYRTPAGSKMPTVHEERIRCKGRPDEVIEVEETIWGPVFGSDERGRRRALAWVAQRPEALNLSLAAMERAGGVAEALEVGTRAGIPAQNLVVADADGHIGWTVAGAIPNRVGFDGTVPTSWADGSRRWEGLMPPDSHPRLIDPPGGRIWTANNQVVYGASPEIYSASAVDAAPRARQIRDALLAIPRATERDLLRVQMDERALFLERWHTLLIETLSKPGAATGGAREEFRRLATSTWTGRASDSVAYTLVHRWRRVLAEQVFGVLTAPARAMSPSFAWVRPIDPALPLPPFPTRIEGPLWRLVTERPRHLLSARFEDWDQQLLAAVDGAIVELTAEGARLGDLPWGTLNSRIRHPLSAGLGPLGRWFDMEPLPVRGGADMPLQRVDTLMPSERLVVSPGHEEQAIFHMPGGQSGHPLSPHYRDGHAAWVNGDPTPLLPGAVTHTLTLTPK
jgi:penicillin amidase